MVCNDHCSSNPRELWELRSCNVAISREHTNSSRNCFAPFAGQVLPRARIHRRYRDAHRTGLLQDNGLALTPAAQPSRNDVESKKCHQSGSAPFSTICMSEAKGCLVGSSNWPSLGRLAGEQQIITSLPVFRFQSKEDGEDCPQAAG